MNVGNPGEATARGGRADSGGTICCIPEKSVTTGLVDALGREGVVHVLAECLQELRRRKVGSETIKNMLSACHLRVLLSLTTWLPSG